jgi:hypothetical protein
MQNQMVVSKTEEFQRKKQAVHLALSSVLTEEEAVGAVRIWEQHLATATSLFSGLQLFSRNVCMTYGKEGRHVELAQAMSRALMSGVVEHASNDAVPVPASFEEEENEAVVLLLGPEITTPEFISFQLLLQAYLRKVDERDAALGEQCRKFLLNVVDNLPWSPEQQKQIINLIRKGSSRQVRPYRPEQLKTFMRHLTLWIRDMLGEVISRQFSLHAIAVVEKAEAGVAYSPREFFSDL